MRILICVPTFETITPDTFRSIYNLDKGDNEVDFDFVRGYDCATARNYIAQKAIDGNYDYVLMVDNDVILPSSSLLLLLEHNVDVVFGYYAHRNNSNTYEGNTCACRLAREDGSLYFNYDIESQYAGSELRQMAQEGIKLVEIHGGGMGCALIRTSVFNQMVYPWFDWVNYNDENRGLLSEDLFFCEKCHSAQIPVYLDTRVGCGHQMRKFEWPV